jgi:hypothetical protein
MQYCCNLSLISKSFYLIVVYYSMLKYICFRHSYESKNGIPHLEIVCDDNITTRKTRKPVCGTVVMQTCASLDQLLGTIHQKHHNVLMIQIKTWDKLLNLSRFRPTSVTCEGFWSLMDSS